MFMLKWHYTADRGFADDHLMKGLTRLGWHWRMT